MKHGDSMQFVSLYRASATEEPDEHADAAILKQSRRQRPSHLAVILVGVLALGAATMALQAGKPADRPVASVASDPSLPPGMDDGREHFLAVSAKPERLGTNVHSDFIERPSQSGGY